MLPSDSEIIARSATDPPAFAAIFDRHFDAIHRYLNRRIGASLADDLAAQAFTEAFAQRRRYDNSRPSALPWLYGIATNLMRRHYRTEQRQLHAYARTGVDPTIEADLEAIHARIDADAAGPRIAAALAALEGRDRDVLLLYAWADQSYEDISKALDIPLGTVRSRLNRARRRMRELLSWSGQYQDDGIRLEYSTEVLDG